MKTTHIFLLHVLLFLFVSCPSSAQNWLWSNGGNGNDEALANTIDKNGNIYTTGYFSLSAKFDTTVNTSSGSGDVFISKQNTFGQYLWTVKAGGTFSDRGYSISADSYGDIFVTGFFSGSAIFGSDTIHSINNTLDIFVTKLDAGGHFLWTKSFGGSDIDIGLDMNADAQGNSIVTGQFRGTAQFGSFSLTSLNDSTGKPTYDIFIIKLDTGGNVTWVKQGASKFDDRGLSVSLDGVGNIYLTGQYSDTLTLDSVYPNVAHSVGFLAKLDTSGNILWFRPMLATQVVVYNVHCYNNDVYISGDFQGQLAIFGPVTTYLNKPFLYKIFVVKLDSSGIVQWASCDGSDNPVSALGLAVDPSGSPYLAGTFNCVMTEYSSLYGAGIFNSIGFRDIFISKFDNSGTRKYERQFGGPHDDYCSAISIYTDDQPVIAGSFETNFNVPNGGNFNINKTNSDSSSAGPLQTSPYCNDARYNSYISLYADGNKDIFTACPIDTARAPYDYFDRGAAVCLRDTLLAVINNGIDTVIACDKVLLFTTRKTGRDGVIGPEYEYQWSNGAITDSNYVTNTGIYYLTLTNSDNCRKYIDSVYALVYITPPKPILATSKGKIRKAIPDGPCSDEYNKLIVIYPDTVWLYPTNVPTGYVVSWSTPYGIVNSDSAQILVSGPYTAFFSTPQGLCPKSTCLWVVVYDTSGSGQCIPKNFVPEIHFTDSTFDATDTVRVCYGDFFDLYLVDSSFWALFHMPDTIPTFVEWQFSGGYSTVFPLSDTLSFMWHYQSLQASYTGPCTVTAIIENPITGLSLDTVIRNFYLDVLPKPPLLGQWHGPVFYCPGDTVLLTVTGGTYYYTSGPGIVKSSQNQDSIWVTQSGRFTCSYVIIDTTSGCMSADTIFFDLKTIPAPHIIMIPGNGVICPGDSVLLIAEKGSNYSWTGPLGNVVGNTQTIYVTSPGFYHYCRCYLIR